MTAETYRRLVQAINDLRLDVEMANQADTLTAEDAEWAELTITRLRTVIGGIVRKTRETT
jgi:hypothetical protein